MVRDLEIGQPINSEKLFRELQKALHAKAKAEAEYRFYAPYDKISREDILAHAYALCSSNKGAPGVDGQDFADIDAYGARQWLGELALLSGRRLTDRTPSEEFSYRRPTANSGRRASRPRGIGSA